MGCILTKPHSAKEKSRDASSKQQRPQRSRRPSWQTRSLNKSMRMAAIRQREAAADKQQLQQAAITPQASSSRRSSIANMSRAHAVCPEPSFDFCNQRRDVQQEPDDYLSQLDCMREQKRNEFEDFGTSPHLTLGAFDRLDFDLTPMENKKDAFF